MNTTPRMHCAIFETRERGIRNKPSTHSTMFVAEDEDFCRWRRILVCAEATIFNIKYDRTSFSSLTTEDKISVTALKLVLCALCLGLYHDVAIKPRVTLLSFVYISIYKDPYVLLPCSNADVFDNTI